VSSNEEGLAPEAKIYRHDEPMPSDGLVAGDPGLIEAITAHIERCIAPIDGVWHEIASEYVHVDVHYIAASPTRPYHVIATSGMSERPMQAPPEVPDDARRAELLMCLPSEWPFSAEAFRNDRCYWPIRWLKTLARFPHQWGTWLGGAHTVPNGDPAKPLGPGTKQAGLLLTIPSLLGEDVHTLTLTDGRVVRFWNVVPLYAEEMDLKLQQGTQTLLDRFKRQGITDLIDPKRINVAAKPKWWRL